jgi:hypothetical protein
MVFAGVAGEYNAANNILTVNQLMFDDSDGKTLGDGWQVTVPVSFSPNKITSGTKIRITASPATFLIATHTLTATEIVQ